MITDELASIKKRILDYGFKRLLLAVSGGLDSICLAHYFIENREALGIEWLGIAHVHHGLREGTADRDAKFVEAFAKSHNVPFFLRRLDGEALKAAEGSLEENARDARYKALVEIALDPSPRKGDHGLLRAEAQVTKETPLHSAQDDTLHTAHPTPHTPYLKGSEATDPTPQTSIAIVTAHHANDQAETMLMRLKRGTTLAGLRGIQEFRALSRGVAGLASEAPLEGVMKDRATGCNQGDTSPTQDDKNSLDPIGSSPLQDDKAKRNCLPSTSYFQLRIFRPFLNVTRAELLEYARKNKLTWCEDESNADVKFARNKIRHEILPLLEKECPGATKQLCRIAELADKAYAKVMEKCEEVFGKALQNKMVIPEQVGDDNAVENDAFQDSGGDDKATPITPHTPYLKAAEGCDPIPHTSISLDKKKLNKILREHANADLSELFRLWLSEKGFRFPIGFFYGSKEPAHVKIPVRAVYRKRSIVKIRHTIKFCEFCTPDGAQKFVSCEMN